MQAGRQAGRRAGRQAGRRAGKNPKKLDKNGKYLTPPIEKKRSFPGR